MDKRQQMELIAYVEGAREITHTEATFKEDQGVIRDFIEAFGDDITFENILKLCASRRVSRGDLDRIRRDLYRWKLYKGGMPVSEILENYVGKGVRACEVIGCPSRDVYGYCERRYRFRLSCSTLRELDELKRWGPQGLMAQDKKKEPQKADWIFGMKCSFKGSSSAIFDGKI